MTYVVRLVAAAVLAAAAGVALPTPAAQAAPCTGDNGVSVVVDFNSLGGGVQQVCVSGGGGDLASSLFPAAGFPLNYASRQPGFVCRVSGVPTSDPCVNTAPADAFWGLWWSEGDASSWTYSSLGAASLKVPDGGMVAFSWDAVSGQAPPSASASHPDAAPTPEPTQEPDQPDPDEPDQPAPGQGSPSGSDEPSSPGSSPSASPDSTSEVEHGKGSMDQQRSPKPEGSPGASPTDQDPTAPDSATPGGSVAEPSTDSDGLPGWVAPGLIGVLFAAAGVVVLVRRRRSGA